MFFLEIMLYNDTIYIVHVLNLNLIEFSAKSLLKHIL